MYKWLKKLEDPMTFTKIGNLKIFNWFVEPKWYKNLISFLTGVGVAFIIHMILLLMGVMI